MPIPLDPTSSPSPSPPRQQTPSPTSLDSLPSSPRLNGDTNSHAPPSPSTLALLSLSQDITALISLSLEATASLVHDWFRSSLGVVGLGEVVRYKGKEEQKLGVRGESGRGLGVVVVGASESTGQSLTLHLAKSGYTVFPLLPLPSPHSPPTSPALSSLLLTWSGMQKRLRARYPSHPGAVVPVITDPESSTPDHPQKAGGSGRFVHAGETVRAYCKENGLSLVAIVCAQRSPRADPIDRDGRRSPKHDALGLTHPHHPVSSPHLHAQASSSPPPSYALIPSPRLLPPAALAMTDESTLLSLYRANVLDPLSVIRELSDLLSANLTTGRGRGRVVFVNGGARSGYDLVQGFGGRGSALGQGEEEREEGVRAAMRMIGAARGEAAKVLRGELGGVGIDVCEVVVGPMSHRIPTSGYHLRQGSEDSADGAQARTKMLSDVLQANQAGQIALPGSPGARQAALTSRLNVLSRIFAVDDALLFSAVRRAIEDRYPRYRHHAGLSPLIESVLDGTPGGGVVKGVGGWVLGLVLGYAGR